MSSQERILPQKDDDFVQQLLSSMSLDDKIGQMAQVDINHLCEDDPHEPGMKRLSQEKVRKVIGEHGTGSVLNYIQNGSRPLTPEEMRQAAIYIQAVAKNYSRPPVIWGLDSVHGANYVHSAVVTPQPINLAATFNTSVAYAAGRLSSKDTRAVGISWLFAPLMGIAIEPKWSRVYETFGEDPKLVSDMGAQFIAGIQDDHHRKDSVPSLAAACAKHFVGYSASHTGNDRAPSWIPTRHLYQYFLPPWEKAIQEQSVRTVMESYTEIDGVPNVANPNALRYLLRQRLGFEGVLVTDYEEILNLNQFHHITNNPQESVVHSLREGSVDMSMIPKSEVGFRDSVNQGIANGTLVEERITRSAERVLRLKANLNMFHEELTMKNGELDTIGQPQDVQGALDMAEQSIVLVKNRKMENSEERILPLDVDAAPSILLTGPTIHSRVYQSGGWTGEWQGVPVEQSDKYFTHGSTVLDAMKATFSKGNVKYTCGVDILGRECQDPLDDENDVDQSGSAVLDQINDAYGKFKDWAGLGEQEPSTSMERAAALATSVDVVFVGLGEEAYAEKPGDLPQRSMNLASGQYELVSLLKQSTNAKVVVVYFGGRPRLLRQIVEYADAIIIGLLPGPMAGPALANIVSGKVNPNGKLPITYPMYEDGGGSPYFHAISDQCTEQDDNNPLPHWDFIPCPVQWPFGFGMSYTDFEYSQLSISSKRLQYTPLGQGGDPPLKVSVNVKNKGDRAGSETVLMFTFDESRSTTPEYKRLRGFEKIYLEAGAETTVTIALPIEDLKFVGPHDDTHTILENGLQFRVGIGAKTDCRAVGGKHSVLCSELVTIDTGADYSGACEAACQLWATSGCADQLSLSSDRCWKMCTSISKNKDVAEHLGEGEEGWGWNYVRCVESVVWGFQEVQPFDPKNQCSKMTSLCRDIFNTEGNDSFGHGPAVSKAAGGSQAPNQTAVVVALSVGLLASVLVAYALRGGFAKNGRGGSVQFTRVSNEDVLTA